MALQDSEIWDSGPDNMRNLRPKWNPARTVSGSHHKVEFVKPLERLVTDRADASCLSGVELRFFRAYQHFPQDAARPGGRLATLQLSGQAQFTSGPNLQ